MKKFYLLVASLLLVLGFSASSMAAALPAGTLLTIDQGYMGKVSYFTMLASTAGYTTTTIRSTDKITGGSIPGSTDGGIKLLTVQLAGTGSHSGTPLGSDTNAIDKPWSFFKNTGEHFQATPTISADPVAGTIDMTGWNVSWTGIPAINMGTGPLGTFTVSGSDYTVHYLATVPAGDPSGFGGVPYGLHIQGRIVAAPPVPEPASLLLIGSGLLGLLGLARRK